MICVVFNKNIKITGINKQEFIITRYHRKKVVPDTKLDNGCERIARRIRIYHNNEHVLT